MWAAESGQVYKFGVCLVFGGMVALVVQWLVCFQQNAVLHPLSKLSRDRVVSVLLLSSLLWFGVF